MNPIQLFKDLIDYHPVSAKRDQGCVVTFAKAGAQTKVVEFDRDTRIELAGIADSGSQENLERLVRVFTALTSFEVHDAYLDRDQVRVLFLNGEDGKGLTFNRNAVVKVRAR